jgi:hypothetical protein
MEKFNCPFCRAEIDVEDKYCRNCGVRLKPVEPGEYAQVQVVPEPKTVRMSPADNPVFVLIMLFFVLGPFALPMLWRSRAFTQRWKWIWTVSMIVFTLLLCWLIYHILVKMILEPLQQLKF